MRYELSFQVIFVLMIYVTFYTAAQGAVPNNLCYTYKPTENGPKNKPYGSIVLEPHNKRRYYARSFILHC